MAERMICPACGIAMNHHADKLVYPTGPHDDAAGIVEELHACPECGTCASRRATTPSTPQT